MYEERTAAVERDEIDYESVGKWIKRVREKHKLTQDDVAAKYFHVSRTVLSKCVITGECELCPDDHHRGVQCRGAAQGQSGEERSASASAFFSTQPAPYLLYETL